MRIVDIKEFTLNTGEKRANAVMDFSGMTTGFVALVTDVVRNGKPVVGYGFSGTGRYSRHPLPPAGCSSRDAHHGCRRQLRSLPGLGLHDAE